MGQAIESTLLTRGHSITGRIGRKDSLEGVASLRIDLAFEFTEPTAAPGLVEGLLTLKVPVLSGTTGWNVDEARRLASERQVPFLHAPNYSIGVAAVRTALASLSAFLARFPEFEAGIVERHHSAKKDAPSGTARSLAETVGLARADRKEPAIVSLRQGRQPGEHIVIFEGEDESVELVHRARSRLLFASGAVKAAEWLLTSGFCGPVLFDDFLERRSGS